MRAEALAEQSARDAAEDPEAAAEVRAECERLRKELADRGEVAADIRGLAALFVRLAAQVIHQPPGDEPAAVAMLLTAKDGHNTVMRLLKLAGYRDDDPGMLRLAMEGDTWHASAPEQVSSEMPGDLNVKPESPGDPYPAWRRARFGPPAHEQQKPPEPSIIWGQAEMASAGPVNGGETHGE